jgi:hypothetical protein
MARNWQYPRWRRLLMQSAMWVILGATVGLAALLDRQKHIDNRPALAAPLQCGAIRLQVPLHWMIEFSAPGMVTATESGVYPPLHLLQVTVAPPAEQGLVDQLLRKENPTDPPQPVKFGVPASLMGTLYTWQEPIEEDGEAHAFGRVIATTVLPNGPEVTLRMEHLARDTQALDLDDDVDLVRRIAATVQIAPADAVPDQD